jgi:hypothetical protein
LEKETKLARRHLIHIYSTFVASFAISMIDTNGKAPSKEEVLLDTLKKFKLLKLQSPEIVNHLFFRMKGLIVGKNTISWDTFKTLASELVPRTIEQKIDLFLESFVPHEVEYRYKEDYHFT